MAPPAHAPLPKASKVAAVLLYLGCTVVFLACAWDRLGDHTPYNHFAHLADAWLHGRHDITPGGPAYAHGNDFAQFGGKTYISFPPLPAVLMLPWLWLAKAPENFHDGQFVVSLAGLAPALLFLALERLRLDGRSPQSREGNLWLAVSFAFGTVYFFCAVEGTVWFAGHVVGAALLCGFLLAVQRARHPLWCGILAGCIFLTRPTMLLTTSLLAFELLGTAPGDTLKERLRNLDKRRLLTTFACFAVPLAMALGLAAAYNHARFETWSPQAFGHEHLSVAWQRRIQKWGLFGYHYLAKNLGVMLTSLPFLRPAGSADALFRVNEHGLALWLTTPLYLLLFFPRRRSPMSLGLWVAAGLPALMNLLYQNSGWRQFGYRFSNDYAPLLFVLLAVRGVRTPDRRGGAHALYAGLLAWSIGVNLFGAITFDRRQFDRYYFRDGSQSIVYQPD